ncbi:hypothetical protein OG243_36845 [Streptomyces sp. NBC_01318]|uniref:hypothetical protein n=1 Tax=unclassified Streptomyces TaxID=2593676 RepID=UPI002DDBC902|nr:MULTISPECIES: hypothetical protein [unclassified Streptomyces]WSC35384.1 hypothetical protein OHA08_07640 [Streptomyces sp. NBC_01763]WSJ54656.1 hypothetical protein OG243_36845 [Streptomyces sp. NBC_01318]
MRGSRVAALLAGLTAALTLSACGVPPSDVIQAGEPASGMVSPSPKSSVPTVIPLYFLHKGDLTPYLRKIGDAGDFGAVVRLLFDGPTTSEAAAATTQLPPLTRTPKVAVGDDKTFSIQLPKDVPPLSRLAMRQLACTVAHVTLPFATLPADADRDGATAAPTADTQRSRAHTSVHVLGDGWTMTQSDDSCPDPLQP